MIKASEGDRYAYTILYNKYFSAVVSFTASLNSQLQSPEDIAQEVFYRIWKKREEYHPTAVFKTFLFTYVRNVIHEQQRHRTVTTNHLEIMIESSNPGTVVQHKELTLIIERAKSKLPEKQLQAVELMFYSNISIDEAAKLAGCSNSVFRRRVCDAKKQLSALLGAYTEVLII
jgi:RNA polymerase sigma-70 factor (ECF subfamily)